MPQIVDIIFTVKKIRATLSLALQSDLWEKYNYSICQIHQLALRTCYSRKDSYWYSSMKDLNSLLLTTENSGLGSNFPFKILIFELRSSPAPSPWNFQWSRGEHGYFLEPQIWGHCAFIVVWEETHVPQIATWHDSRLSACEGDYMTIIIIIISFPHFITDFFSSFIFHHHIAKIIIV